MSPIELNYLSVYASKQKQSERWLQHGYLWVESVLCVFLLVTMHPSNDLTFTRIARVYLVEDPFQNFCTCNMQNNQHTIP